MLSCCFFYLPVMRKASKIREELRYEFSDYFDISFFSSNPPRRDCHKNKEVVGYGLNLVVMR